MAQYSLPAGCNTPTGRCWIYLQSRTADRRHQFSDGWFPVECDVLGEKLAWFRVINTAGEKLTPQELLNAIYSGPWVTDAKRYFSKSNAPAYLLANDYVSGALNRQEYLETVLRWIRYSWRFNAPLT